MNSKVAYTVGGTELLDAVGPLWYELLKHHSPLSQAFGDFIATRNWDDRKAELEKKNAAGGLRVELVYQDGEPVGYCVTSIDGARIGEIESLFLAESMRGQGIGRGLMQRAVAWLDANAVASKHVQVLVGNERVHTLYASFGFLPFTWVLRQK